MSDTPTDQESTPTAKPTSSGPIRLLKAPAMWCFVGALVLSYIVGRTVTPQWILEKTTLDVHVDEEDDSLYYIAKDKPAHIHTTVPAANAKLTQAYIDAINASTEPVDESTMTKEQFVTIERKIDGKEMTQYERRRAVRHFGLWSLLPALVAVGLCWLLKEPLTALCGGIISGSFLLGYYDLTDQVLVKQLSTEGAAGVLILYLWLLGGLMGIWAKTGAAKAFAEFMTKHFVRGPRTAKLVAWSLGIIFFQGGTVSTVLVGTTVKPLADKENISHEELAYIVDSTASPIASQLAFNAWPGYIQAFIFVAGVPWLVTEADRVTFFFRSVPFCFYAIFAVLFTFLLSIDKPLFIGKRMRQAIKRSRETGQLDRPGSDPLSSKELQTSNVPEGYTPHVYDFFVPLLVLIGVAIGTFIVMGSPQVRWAFGLAVLCAMVMAMVRGMSLKNLIEGVGDGMKGVVIGSVILLLAMTIGNISKSAGGGVYLVEMLGDTVPFWALPVLLQILTIIISFSTGTSWGTYAVAFPLAMPLAWAVSQGQNMDHPMFYMTICFAAVMDGSVFGDQCSPISDTTVLSSMCTGCDLMDHVKTQLPQATVAALLASVGWTALTFFAA